MNFERYGDLGTVMGAPPEHHVSVSFLSSETVLETVLERTRPPFLSPTQSYSLICRIDEELSLAGNSLRDLLFHVVKYRCVGVQ